MLAAFADSGGANGRIRLAAENATGTGTVINAGGRGAGNNGNVTFLAGGSGSSITTGTVNSSSGNGSSVGTGVVSIQTAQPEPSDGSMPIVFGATGTITNGNRLVAGARPPGADVRITGDLTALSVVMHATGDITNHANRIRVTNIGGSSATSTALSPDGARLYVAHLGTNTVSVVDAATDALVSTIAVGSSPRGVNISPDGTRVYVSNFFDQTVSVIDTATNTVIDTIPSPTPLAQGAMNLSGTKLFYTSPTDNSVYLLSTSNSSFDPVPIDLQASGPTEIAYNRSNDRIYVSNSSGTLSEINPDTNALVANHSLNFLPTGIGVCPCGTKLLLPDSLGSSVVSFAIETNSEVAAGSLSITNPSMIAVNPTGAQAYVGSTTDIQVFDTVTNSVSDTLDTTGLAGSLSSMVATFIDGHPTLFLTTDGGLLVNYRTPIISARTTELRADNGRIVAATGATSVNAAAQESVVVWSSGNLVSTGGTANNGAFQYATTASITNNGVIEGALVDLHAISGVFTNNGSIHAHTAALVIAAPNLVNTANATLSSSGSSGPIWFQSPSGILNVTLNGTSSIISEANNFPEIVFNPAGGEVMNVIGTGSIVSDPLSGNITFRGSDDASINVNVGAIDGVLNFPRRAASIAVQTARNDINVCGCIDLSPVPGSAGSGGNMSFRALGGNIFVSGPLITTGDDLGTAPHHRGGNIVLQAQQSVQVLGFLQTDGNNGADAGNITMIGQTGGAGVFEFFGLPLSAQGLGGGNGGNLLIQGTEVAIIGVDSDGFSINTSSDTNNAGSVRVVATANSLVQPSFEMGSGFCGCNGMQGGILANGANLAGRIDLLINTRIVISSDISIQATGTGNASGSAGRIQFSTVVPGSMPLLVENDGTIMVDGALSVIGFNAGPGQLLTVTTPNNTGTLNAPLVTFGYLNPATLIPVLPFNVAPPATSSFVFTNSGGANINVVQSQSMSNIQVSNFVPAAPASLIAGAQSSPRLVSFVSSPSLTAEPTAPFDALVPRFASSTILPTDQVYQPTYLDNDVSSSLGYIKRDTTTETFISGIRANGFDRTLTTSQSVSATVDELNKIVKLTAGNVLFIATTNMTIETPHATLGLSIGSVAFVMVDSDGTNIYALHDEHDGGILMNVGDSTFALRMGHEAVVASRTVASFEAMHGPAIIPTRALRRTELGGTDVLYGAEFSVPVALRLIQPIRSLKQSNQIQDRNSFATLLRDAAILNIVTASGGPYKKSKN